MPSGHDEGWARCATSHRNRTLPSSPPCCCRIRCLNPNKRFFFVLLQFSSAQHRDKFGAKLVRLFWRVVLQFGAESDNVDFDSPLGKRCPALITPRACSDSSLTNRVLYRFPLLYDTTAVIVRRCFVKPTENRECTR